MIIDTDFKFNEKNKKELGNTKTKKKKDKKKNNKK